MPGDKQSGNPFNLQPLGPDGPYIPGPTLCSPRRREYLQRSHSILGFYTALLMYASKGHEWAEAGVKQHGLTDETEIRLSFGTSVFQAKYGALKRIFATVPGHLANQVFLMIYGNFEAFLLDVVADGFREVGTADPDDEAINLVMRTKWPGKIDRLSQRLGVSLPKRLFVDRFKDLDMGFLGEACTDPIDFLDRMGAVRHRLVHSTGRASEKLVRDYPKSGLKVGDLIALPFDLPHGIHFFFVKLTDLFDEQFCATFKWKRLVVRPEHLGDSSAP